MIQPFLYMTKRIFVGLASFSFATILLLGCNESSVIGSDLIPPGDNLVVERTDTVTLLASTILEDSLETWDLSEQTEIDDMLLGRVNHNTLGAYQAEIFTQIELGFINPDFSNSEFDSIVLILALDTFEVYGELQQPQSYHVYRMTEDFAVNDVLYSNKTFLTDAPNVLGSVTNWIPNYTDSILVDTVKERAQIRIRLDDALKTELFDTMDLSMYQSDEDLQTLFKGLHIVPDVSNTAMVSVDMNALETRVLIYYTKDDTVSTFFPFLITESTGKTSYFNHDEARTTAPISMYVGDTDFGDSVVYVQGMAGANIKIDFPHAEAMNDQNIIVNKAVLQLSTLENDATDFNTRRPYQLTALRKTDDGRLVLNRDVTLSLGRVGGFGLFGGDPQLTTYNGNNAYLYEVNMSAHFLEMMTGNTESSLYISLFPKTQSARRISVGGPAHSERAMKLILTYTKY